MKKTSKKIKILAFMLLTILLIGNINNAFAFDIGEKNLISLGECERYLTYNGTPIKTTYIVYEMNGVHYPAYCLDVSLPGAEQGEYAVSGNQKYQNTEVWRAIINGFPYKSVAELGAANEQEAFTATKQAVYTMLYNRDTSSYGAVNTEAGQRTYQIYLNIVNAARSSTAVIENNLSVNINSVSESWAVDNINKKCVSKVYNISSTVNSGLYDIYTLGLVPNGTIVTDINNNIKNTFSIGEEFKILIPIQNLTQSESFTIEAKAKLETKPIVYGTTKIPGKQNYALTGCMYEEAIGNFVEDYFKNITKVIVVKKEYATEKRLAGVKFNLLDENKNLFKSDLETNSDGEIILENMIPGKYYLQEKETLEDYNIYTDLIEINLDLNEEFKVTVNNTKREITQINKDFELIEVNPTYEETVINENTISTIYNKKIEKKLPKTGY